MRKLTPEIIKRNWDKHLTILNNYISSPKKEKLLDFYDRNEEKMVLAPASGKEHYHNAFPGGYIDHVNRVIEGSLRVKEVWEKMGADIDFTDEQLVFVAIVHDLGKIGDDGEPFFIPQDNKWRKENLGEHYTYNPELDFMVTSDRSLFLLQKNDIQLTPKEWIAIKIHDGMYEDTNKPYYISYSPDSHLKSNLAFIVHQADLMACKVERNLSQKES